MNKNKLSRKELMNILRVTNEAEREIANKYAKAAKQICKAFSDIAVTTREFEAALRILSKHMSPVKNNEEIRSSTRLQID